MSAPSRVNNFVWPQSKLHTDREKTIRLAQTGVQESSGTCTFRIQILSHFVITFRFKNDIFSIVHALLLLLLLLLLYYSQHLYDWRYVSFTVCAGDRIGTKRELQIDHEPVLSPKLLHKHQRHFYAI